MTMNLKPASWSIVPEILTILKKNWPESKTSYYCLKHISEDRKILIDGGNYHLLTPDGTSDSYGTFIVIPGDGLSFSFETLNPDLGLLTTAIANCPLIGWGKEFIYCGPIHQRLYPITDSLRDFVNCQTFSATDTVSYHLSVEEAKNISVRIPADVTVELLKEEHAKIVNDVWPHGRGEKSRQKLVEFINLGRAVGLFKKDSNKLVSWCFELPYGGPAILQTADDEMRKGYGEAVLRVMTKKLGDGGIEPQGFIVDGNAISLQLFTKLNYKPGYASRNFAQSIQSKGWCMLGFRLGGMLSSIVAKTTICGVTRFQRYQLLNIRKIVTQHADFAKDSGMDLRETSWTFVPEILQILKEKGSKPNTSFYMLNGYYEIKKKHSDLECILLTPSGQVERYGTFVLLLQGDLYGIYTETLNPDWKPLLNGLVSSKLIDWTKEVTWGPTHSRHFPLIAETAKLLNLKFADVCAVRSHSISNAVAKAITYQVPEHVYIGKLREEHAQLVNSLWPHGVGEQSLQEVKNYIKYRESIAIYEKCSNKLVAWVLHLEYGGGGCLQVLPGEERRGYGELTLRALIKLMADQDFQESFILVDNVTSIRLCKKLGYVAGDYRTWVTLAPSCTAPKLNCRPWPQNTSWVPPVFNPILSSTGAASNSSHLRHNK